MMSSTVANAFYLENPVPYAEMAVAQERFVAARMADAIGDAVFFLEHLPVVTLGRRGVTASLVKSPRSLASRGISFSQSTRGGDVTYHAPGQIVMYPILKLTGREADVHCYTHALEEIAIRTAASFKVEAFRRDGMTGAWTQHGKLAAIGVRLKRWVTSHGMSFNVNPDLAGFESIVPCGLRNERVTSVEAILGEDCPSLIDVRESMALHFSDVLGRTLKVRRMSGTTFLRNSSAM